jgi:hypothetical protein
MGVVTTTGKNFMLDALFRNTLGAADVTHVGLFDHDAGINVTGETVDDVIDAVGHPFANGDIIIFTAKNGGSNIRLLYPYYVIADAANTFQIAETSGGAAIDFGSDLIATTTVRRLVEVSGGAPAYTREAIAYSAAAGGAIDDSTNGAVFDVPAGVTVDSVGFFDAAAAGTLQAWDDVTPETFAAQGTYTVTDADHDLNT